MTVDHRPLPARKADRIVIAALLGIVGCGILGAALGIKAAVHLTTTPKEASC